MHKYLSRSWLVQHFSWILLSNRYILSLSPDTEVGSHEWLGNPFPGFPKRRLLQNISHSAIFIQLAFSCIFSRPASPSSPTVSFLASLEAPSKGNDWHFSQGHISGEKHMQHDGIQAIHSYAHGMNSKVGETTNTSLAGKVRLLHSSL